MNIGQKILTVVMLAVFVTMGFAGLSIVQRTDLWRLLVVWFLIAVTYAGLFFVLKSRPK